LDGSVCFGAGLSLGDGGGVVVVIVMSFVTFDPEFPGRSGRLEGELVLM